MVASIVPIGLALAGRDSSPRVRLPLVIASGYVVQTVAGIAAGFWLWRRERSRGWLVLLALQLGALAVTVMQVRGAYDGAVLAAPALAAVLVAARRAGALPLAGAWLASAGMLYPLAAQAIVPAPPSKPGARCTAPDLVAALGALPPGRVQ